MGQRIVENEIYPSNPQEEFTRELMFRIGKILEMIGNWLITDDYKDYVDRENAHPGWHHWCYGEIIRNVGLECQKTASK